MLNDDMITAHDALGQLGIICQPTLVLYGEHHFCTPLPLSEEIARAVPGAELIILGDAGELIELQREEAFSVFSLSAVTRGGFDNLGGGVGCRVYPLALTSSYGTDSEPQPF